MSFFYDCNFFILNVTYNCNKERNDFLKKTNIEKLKEILYLFLMMDVEETEFSPLVVLHPIFESGVACNGEGNMVNILEAEGLEEIRNQTKKRIDKCKSASQCMLIMRKSYYLTFLKFTKEYMSSEDFSKLLRDAWIASEAPNQDVNVSQKTVLRWFKEATKELLMRNEDFSVYSKLPEQLTIYRGIGSKSRKNGISWTLDKDKAIWFAKRFSSNGYVLQGIAEKKDVLAFFNDRNEKEIIISPQKIKEKIKLP